MTNRRFGIRMNLFLFEASGIALQKFHPKASFSPFPLIERSIYLAIGLLIAVKYPMYSYVGVDSRTIMLVEQRHQKQFVLCQSLLLLHVANPIFLFALEFRKEAFLVLFCLFTQLTFLSILKLSFVQLQMIKLSQLAIPTLYNLPPGRRKLVYSKEEPPHSP